MSVWGEYETRLSCGSDDVNNPKRSSYLSHSQSLMTRKLVASLSYADVSVNGENQNIAVVNEKDFSSKKIFSLPGETLQHGALVSWSGSMWLITEVDANSEYCCRGRMIRCNYNLKWINSTGSIVQRWCVIEDSAKFFVGEKSSDIITIGESRIAIIVGKDSETEKLKRGMRFLIDDPDSSCVLAYQITRPNTLYNIYNGQGVYSFVLSEVNTTDDDNMTLRVADYYSWKPESEQPTSDTQTGDRIERVVQAAISREEGKPSDIERRKVWL